MIAAARRTPILLLLALAAIALAPAARASAAPGDDDAGFTALHAHLAGGSSAESVMDVVVQPDGRILAAILDVGEVDRRIVRLLPDGRLDPSFGDGGTWHLPRAAATYVRALALQDDGKILFAGEDATRPAIVVGRLTADGQLDPGFGGDGMHVAVTATGSAPLVQDVQVQGDGRIVFAGVVKAPPRSDELFVGRLLASGTDDPDFRGEPYTTIGSPFDHEGDAFGGMALMPGGDIVVGDVRQLGPPIVWRIAGNGTYFVAANVDLPSDLDVPLSMVVTDPAHVMLLAGSGGTPYTTALAWLDVATTPKVVREGTTDGTKRPFPASFRGHALARQADGKLLVAGVDVTGGIHRAIARVDTDGTLDDSFGAGGVRHLGGTSTTSFYLATHSIATAPDGSIVSGWNVLDGTGTRMSALDRIVGRLARLTVRVDVAEPSAVVERTTTFTIHVANDGPDGSGPGSVAFDLDPAARVMSVTGPSCTADARGGRCAFGNLAGGSSTDVVVRLRAGAPGIAGLVATASATTYDDDRGDDHARGEASFATPVVDLEPTPIAAAPRPSGRPRPQASRAPRVLLQRISAVNGRLLPGCATLRRACAVRRVTLRRPRPYAFVRMTLLPPPPVTARRFVRLHMQQRVGRRWVTRYRPTVPLGTSGITDARLPAEWRLARSTWRMRIVTVARRGTRALSSGWLYWRVR
jgi:uncharacterized delta-60 repeat protein